MHTTPLNDTLLLNATTHFYKCRYTVFGFWFLILLKYMSGKNSVLTDLNNNVIFRGGTRKF